MVHGISDSTMQTLKKYTTKKLSQKKETNIKKEVSWLQNRVETNRREG